FQLNWNYPSWSISSEWFAYLIFPLVASRILRRITTRGRAVAFGILSLGASLAVILLWRARPFFELALVVPTFVAGTAVYSIVHNESNVGVPPPAAHLSALFVLLIGAVC